MRILDEDNDRILDKITLYLRKNELKDLMDSLANMLSRSESSNGHISDSVYVKAITICIDDEIVLQDSKTTP